MSEETYQNIVAKVQSGEHVFNAVYPHGMLALWHYFQANHTDNKEHKDLLFPE